MVTPGRHAMKGDREMNRKVNVNGKSYEMYLVKWTNWIFVKSPKSGRTYSIAQVIDNEIVELDNEPALNEVSNLELAKAWINN